jgi:hypothetical protein
MHQLPTDAAGMSEFVAQANAKIAAFVSAGSAPHAQIGAHFETAPSPDHVPAADYHWTPVNQRRFLEELAICGNITTAAKSVAMSSQAAYAFRHKTAGVLFKMAWDAAVLMARARLSDILFDRAIAGQTEIYERDADSGRITRTRTNNALGMAVLKRLDEMAVSAATVPADTAMAQIVAGDFEAFLDVISDDGDHEDKILSASMFLIERAGALPVMQLWPAQFARYYQLALESAALADAEAEAAAAAEAALIPPAPSIPPKRIWQGFMNQQLATNFPPPAGFNGTQDGKYGDSFYSRSCSFEELGIINEMAEVQTAPRRAADQIARDAYFAAMKAEIERLRGGDGDAEFGDDGCFAVNEEGALDG